MFSQYVIPQGGAVPFDFNGLIQGDMSHALGSTDLLVWTTGHFLVQYDFSCIEISQFGIFLNGNVIYPSIFGSSSGSQQNTGFTIFSVQPVDLLPNVLSPTGFAATIQARNHISFVPSVQLQSTSAGSAQPQVNASLYVRKLDSLP
jgi:hypothetical protein